jgi:aminopeptidase N
VGDERYTIWLRVYFTRYRYRIVHAEDLLMVADETGIGAAVRQAYSQWILSAGRP